MLRNTVLLITALVVSCQLFGGGVNLYEISSADLRLASAGWSSRAMDPSTLFTNPAGMTRFCDRALEMGAQPIFSHVTFDPNSNTNVTGDKGHANIWLPSGSLFYIQPLNESLTLGFGNCGYFGSDLVYNHDWVGRYYVQKALMEGISFVPAAAYRLNDCWSFGAGLNIMYGFMKQRSAVNNKLDNLADGYFTLRSYRFGFGGIFGVLYEPSECTRFGVQYMTSVKLKFHAKPHFHNIGPTLNQILTATGIEGSKLDLLARVPQGVMFSAYHDLNACWSVMADVGWQQWSRFQSVVVTLADTNANSFRFTRKFQDTWHVAAGAEWHVSERLTLSGGLAYDSSCVTNAERTLDFPIGEQWRFGTGFRWAFKENMVFDFSTELQWQGDLKLDENKGTLASRVAGNFRNAYAFFTSLNLTWAF